MFTVTQSNQAISPISAAGFPVQLSLIGFAPTAAIENNSPVGTIVPPAPIIPVNGVVIVDAPPDLRIRTIVIAGITYVYTLQSPPLPGQFTELNGQLQIGYLGLVPPMWIAYYQEPQTIPTNVVLAPFPDLFTEFPLTGEISWTLTWEEQPQASITFMTDAEERASVIGYFSSPRRIDIYGVGFCPSGQLSITDISLTKSAIALIEVSVTLNGWHSHLLDRQIALGKQLFLPDCSAPPLPGLNTPDSMTVQDLASLVGTSVQGAAIYIDYEILQAPAVVTTLGSNLTSESIRSIGCFVDYNSSGSIVLKGYNSVASWTVDDIRSDVRSNINNRLNGNDSEAGYYKTYDPLTEVSYGSAIYIVPNSSAPKPTWQPKQIEYTETIEGDINASDSPYSGNQKDLSIVFDISGKRKRFKKITLANGQPIREVETEYGYTAVAKDDMQLSGGATPETVAINGNWRAIERKTTDYRYNDLGYLNYVSTSGTSLNRYRVENAQKPESLAVRISGTNPDPREVAKLESFQFFNLPIIRSEIYELTPFSRYYSDIKNPQVSWSICFPDGVNRLDIQIDDPSWIPPYFVSTKTVIESGSSGTVNPQSTALKPLPTLTAGKSGTFVERVVVGKGSDGKDPTYYTKSTDNYASSGAQLNTTLSIAESQIVSGRPPVASNLGATKEQVKNVKTTYKYKGDTIVATKPPGERILVEPKPAPFLIKSGLSDDNTGFVITGKISFAQAPTAEKALEAAQIDIDLINAKNTVSETLTIPWDPNIRPGDRFSYRVNGQTRNRRVISVSQKLKIEGVIATGEKIVTSDGTDLKLGLDVRTPLIKTILATRTSTIN